MKDEIKNGGGFLVTVLLDAKKGLSCSVKKFPTLHKGRLD